MTTLNKVYKNILMLILLYFYLSNILIAELVLVTEYVYTVELKLLLKHKI